MQLLIVFPVADLHKIPLRHWTTLIFCDSGRSFVFHLQFHTSAPMPLNHFLDCAWNISYLYRFFHHCILIFHIKIFIFILNIWNIFIILIWEGEKTIYYNFIIILIIKAYRQHASTWHSVTNRPYQPLYLVNFLNAVHTALLSQHWDSKIHRLHLCWGIRLPLTSVLDMTLNKV